MMRSIDTILFEKSVFIFDLDGTLIESVALWNTVDSILHKELMIPLASTEEIALKRNQSITRNFDKENVYFEYCRELAGESPLHMGASEVYARRRAISKELLFQISIKPGVQEFISFIHRLGKRIILATNSRAALLDSYCRANEELRCLLTEYFDAFYTLESAKTSKPSPEIFLKIMEDFCCLPGECIVFEDSKNGIAAANAANIDVVYVQNKCSDDDVPEYILHCISNYHDLLKTILLV